MLSLDPHLSQHQAQEHLLSRQGQKTSRNSMGVEPSGEGKRIAWSQPFWSGQLILGMRRKLCICLLKLRVSQSLRACWRGEVWMWSSLVSGDCDVHLSEALLLRTKPVSLGDGTGGCGVSLFRFGLIALVVWQERYSAIPLMGLLMTLLRIFEGPSDFF